MKSRSNHIHDTGLAGAGNAEPTPQEQKLLIRHPVLSSVIVLLVLFLSYAISGTALYLGGIETISPVFPANIVLSVVILMFLRKTKAWKLVFFRSPENDGASMKLYVPLVLVLAITAVTSIAKSGITVSSASNLIYLVLLAVSVGFVEEVVFRGIIIAAWLKKGVYTAVIASTLLFSVGHLAQVMGGQSLFGTILQMVFSFVLGLALALVVVKTGSIWFVMLFHALFDFVQFISTSPTASVLSNSLDLLPLIGTAVCTIILGAYSVWLFKHVSAVSANLAAE